MGVEAQWNRKWSGGGEEGAGMSRGEPVPSRRANDDRAVPPHVLSL